MDVLVIGGGISGMLVARELAGAARVTLLERGRTGREASWAGGGILSPLYPWRYPDAVTRLAAWSQGVFSGLAGELAEESGVDPQWTPSGLLFLDTAEREAAMAWAARVGARMEWLGSEGLHGCEPAVGPGHAGALWMPEVAQVRNPRLVSALRGSIASRGVEVREGTPVTGLRVGGGRVLGVETPAGPIDAGCVVLAGGAWSAGLLAGVAGVRPAVAPVRGQMVLLRTRPGLVRRMVLSGGRYVIPRRDGRVLVGSTLEHVGFDKATTEQARRDLVAAAGRLVPALSKAPLEHHWAGLRPGSPGGVPYVCAHPQVAGLYLNAGHYRNGVVLGPACARLAADLVLGRVPIVDPGPYALDAERPPEEGLRTTS